MPKDPDLFDSIYIRPRIHERAQGDLGWAPIQTLSWPTPAALGTFRSYLGPQGWCLCLKPQKTLFSPIFQPIGLLMACTAMLLPRPGEAMTQKQLSSHPTRSYSLPLASLSEQGCHECPRLTNVDLFRCYAKCISQTRVVEACGTREARMVPKTTPILSISSQQRCNTSHVCDGRRCQTLVTKW